MKWREPRASSRCSSPSAALAHPRPPQAKIYGDACMRHLMQNSPPPLPRGPPIDSTASQGMRRRGRMAREHHPASLFPTTDPLPHHPRRGGVPAVRQEGDVLVGPPHQHSLHRRLARKQARAIDRRRIHRRIADRQLQRLQPFAHGLKRSASRLRPLHFDPARDVARARHGVSVTRATTPFSRPGLGIHW